MLFKRKWMLISNTILCGGHCAFQSSMCSTDPMAILRYLLKIVIRFWWQTLSNFTPLSLVAYWLFSVSLIANLLPLRPWLLPVDKCIELIALAESSCRYPGVQISMDYIRFSQIFFSLSVPQAISRWFTTPLFYNYVKCLRPPYPRLF